MNYARNFVDLYFWIRSYVRVDTFGGENEERWFKRNNMFSPVSDYF